MSKQGAIDSYYKNLKWDSRDKVDRYTRMVAAVTNQEDRRKGFGNKDAGEPTEGKHKRRTEAVAHHVVRKMIDG